MSTPTPNQEPVTPPEPPKEENDFYKYASGHTRDLIAYVLMVLGIILLFFQPMYGGFLIGLVAGVYFGKEIIDIGKNLEHFVEEQGVGRSLVLAGTLIGFFISAPAIFIGIAIVVLIRLFVFSEENRFPK